MKLSDHTVKEVLKNLLDQEGNICDFLSNLWVVEVRESECGWGSDTWHTLFSDLKSAEEYAAKINKDNPTDRVPDWYMVASNPMTFAAALSIVSA